MVMAVADVGLWLGIGCSLLLLLLVSEAEMAAQNPHPMNAAVGRPFTINIPDCTIEDSYSVTWKKNNAESIVKVKMISDHASSPCASCTIHGNGSLTLHSAPAGRNTYNVEVYNNGKSVCLRTIEVTGQDAVDTPSINITCAEKKRVHVYCFISRGTNPKLQLIVQNVTLKKSQGNDLKYEGPLKTHLSSFTCAAENLVSAEASTEMVNCDGIEWTWYLILATAAGGVAAIIFLILIIYSVKACKRSGDSAEARAHYRNQPRPSTKVRQLPQPPIGPSAPLQSVATSEEPSYKAPPHGRQGAPETAPGGKKRRPPPPQIPTDTLPRNPSGASGQPTKPPLPGNHPNEQLPQPQPRTKSKPPRRNRRSAQNKTV